MWADTPKFPILLFYPIKKFLQGSGISCITRIYFIGHRKPFRYQCQCHYYLNVIRTFIPVTSKMYFTIRTYWLWVSFKLCTPQIIPQHIILCSKQIIPLHYVTTFRTSFSKSAETQEISRCRDQKILFYHNG